MAFFFPDSRKRPVRGGGSGLLVAVAGALWFSVPFAHAILAGHENYFPNDAPSLRVDSAGASSAFNFAGSLSINSGGSSYIGSAAALSPNWVLTAGHNLDFNNDGQVDGGISATFHLPDFGVFGATSFFVQPLFTGFGNPSIHHDLALLYFKNPLPSGLNFPGFSFGLGVGDVVTLAGFGRSGYGSYGYTTSASLTNRRVGGNTIETFTFGTADPAEVFRYTFGHPDTVGSPGGSLANNVETIIGPGDSGGPMIVERDGLYLLAGVNTFIEGYGGRFGDTGGGILLESYYDWIGETTGLVMNGTNLST